MTTQGWQHVVLEKSLIFAITELPEAGLSTKGDEKIMVKVPEGLTVLIKCPTSSFSQKSEPPTTYSPSASAVVAHGTNTGNFSPNAGPAKQAKTTQVYQPKHKNTNSPHLQKSPNQSNGVNGGSGSGGGGGGGHVNVNANNNSNRQPKQQQKQRGQQQQQQPKAITTEELKKQKEEEATRAEWLAQRRDYERREREEQDRRYRERMEKLKAQKDKMKEQDDTSRERKKCWVCNSEDHMSRKCPEKCKRGQCNKEFGPHPTRDCKDACELCTEKGHDAWYCPKRCGICRNEAHLLKECTVKCSLCGEPGHRERSCPFSYNNAHSSN